MHSPPCETWRVHLRRSFVESGSRHVSLHDFVDDTLHSWDTELLVNDPEFYAEYQRLTDETRAAMDTAKKITDPWVEMEKLPASSRTDL